LRHGCREPTRAGPFAARRATVAVRAALILEAAGSYVIAREDIDADLVARLIAAQFPEWAELEIRPVEPGGWDNRTFRLGDELSVRLPSGDGYAAQVDKEQRWLPRLAPHLPLPIPAPVARGVPGEGYPFAWSVVRWLEGEPASPATIADPTEFAAALADFLTALARVDASDGPPPGPHNFWRGGPVRTYEQETLEAIDALGRRIPRRAALAVWDDAVHAGRPGEPVWFHGDVAAGNLLVRDGRLSAVIDFGSCGVGDPACDLVIAWTLLSGESRAAFRAALAADDAAWARGRGWALWKALITFDDPASPHVVDEVLADR
jgi:aminoglycoside phosphotransferase (APT) family kinase protein